MRSHHETGSRRIFENTAPSGATLMAFEIDRARIESKDTEFFLEFWDLARIARSGRLRDVFGKVLFMVGGYDQDERAIFEIPEVRRYLRELTEAWPYFFYADNLQTPFLGDLIKCIVPSVVVATTDDDPTHCTTRMETADVDRAYQKLFDGLIEACKMDDGMTDSVFEARADAVRKQIQKHFF
jgi:hypothetical protein